MTFPTTTVQTPCQGVSPDESPAGPASRGGAQSPFWRHVQELLKLQRLHANSDDVLEIAMRSDLTDDERLQELERLAEKKTQRKEAEMLQSPQTQTKPNTEILSASQMARTESGALATDIRRLIMSRPAHIQMLAVSQVLADLVAKDVLNRQLGPVEGLIENIEGNLDFDNAQEVRQYARGLAALAEDIRCRLANL